MIGSSDEEQENSGGETELPEIDPRAEDRELKNHLLRKYSGYLSSLKQELSKKKKKGKLPKEARQKLLSWWELHYKWPYPSVCESLLYFGFLPFVENPTKIKISFSPPLCSPLTKKILLV